MTAMFVKDPDERLDYDVDFARWLPAGDTIASAVALISGTTATVHAVEPSTTTVRVWLTGGTAGQTGTVTVRATTAAGRIKEAAFRIRIRGTL